MLDILRPAATKVKPAPAHATSPTTSPASSTSTLKASSSSKPSSHSKSHHTKSSTTSYPGTSRSKGQQARRQSIESAVSSSHRHKHTLQQANDDLLRLDTSTFRRSTFASDARHSTSARNRSKAARSQQVNPAGASNLGVHGDQPNRSTKRPRAQQPLLGGLYFSDLIVVAFFYAVNLLRTCGIAELVDVAFKAFTYVCTRLPFDFCQRWSLSRPPSSHFARYPPLNVASAHQQHDSLTTIQSRPKTARPTPQNERIEVRPAPSSRESFTAASALASSSEDESTSHEDAFQDDPQLSPFHHLTLLLVRFACTSFPHLVPRILFAEETIGPLVRWRTGGGAAGIVREFTSEPLSSEPASARPTLPAASSDTAEPQPKSKDSRPFTRPGFRAFWIGADAHVPVEVRRSDPSARSASTLLYLHGGGFSLGSVAFYAEALIRIITKVCGIEQRDNDARCVAVEYDLGPTSRFPGPLLQCLRCYAHLIEVEGIDPTFITIAGDSAGGNLAMAMLLCLDGQARGDARLAERDWSKLPMPGKAVLISPWADLRPSASLAFAPLRDAAASAHAASNEAEARSRSGGSNVLQRPAASVNARVSAWTEAIGQHEWDYVAAEALMHFAQLYAGVLKTPRRVRGPMGWVAHMCAVLAGDDDDATAASSPAEAGKSGSSASTATAPLAILRTLLLPSQKIARAAHTMLTEPLLNRAKSARPPFSTATKPTADAFNQVENIRPSAVGALDPIFPATERKTDAVPSTADLYIPIWDSPSSVDQHQEKQVEHQGHLEDPDFEAAKELLETSQLVNPAIGDWSRIKLRRGMLVLWGDRERLADDIEIWIDRVRESQSTRGGRNATMSDDQPSQDIDPSHPPKSLQERRAASRSPYRRLEDLPERAADWLCTAAEHGPGGVHAWPFVSMYLAGSEEEREKGLEIIARFIAESTPSPASTQPPTPASPAASLAVQLPVSYQQPYLSRTANSPPHLNAVSPAGSMPSDISSRGDADDGDYPFLGSSYTGSEGWAGEERNELGLQGVYPHETVWPENTPTPSTGIGTPMDSDVETESIGHDELVHRIGLGLAGSGSDGRANAGGMEPVHLHRPATHGGGGGGVVGSSWGPYAEPQRADVQKSRTRSARSSSQPQVLGGPPGGRSLADLEAESDMSAPPSRPESPGWRDGSVGYDTHDDDVNDDEDIDAPSPQELDRDDAAYFGNTVTYADDAIPMDPGFYGLAHYHTLRPEGLSDIAEEESQFDTSSVLSSGTGALSPGFSDPAFSPEDGRSPRMGAARAGANPGRYGAAFTPSAAEMARLREALDERERQYQERFRRSGGRFVIEEDDSIGEDSDADADADADVDHLHMDGPEGGEARGSASPWRSSAELARLQGQQPSREGSSLSVNSMGAELQPPPSPARSNSSQTSSARDVWW